MPRERNVASILDVKARAAQGARGRRRVVAVIGSGETANPHCEEVGRLIATLGCDLLTGGGRGVMEAVGRAFFETNPRRGVAIGIIPACFAFALFGAGLDTAISAHDQAYRACLAEARGDCHTEFDPAVMLTPELLAALALLAVVGLIPVAIKRWRRTADVRSQMSGDRSPRSTGGARRTYSEEPKWT